MGILGKLTLFQSAFDPAIFENSSAHYPIAVKNITNGLDIFAYFEIFVTNFEILNAQVWLAENKL